MDAKVFIINKAEFDGPCLLCIGISLDEPWQLYQTAEKDRGIIIKWVPAVFMSLREAEKTALESANRLSSTADLKKGFSLHYLIVILSRGGDMPRFVHKKITIKEKTEMEKKIEIIK